MKYLDTLSNQLKKTLINEISTRLLRLEFKSDNIKNSGAREFIVKIILPEYK